MTTTATTANIFIKSCGGFGNKVFDLISAIYLKNKYEANVYFAVCRSDGPFFGSIFPKSIKKIIYIDIDNFIKLKQDSEINEILINKLDELPNQITTNTRFMGLNKFAYVMYNSMTESDKKIFEIDINSLNLDKYSKYINISKRNFACVHIRYGDRLCYALNDLEQTKYTSYMLPVYSPQYYIDQINELLKENLDEILVITDSISLVEKLVIEKVNKQKQTKILYPSHETIELFYLMTKAKYIIMSYSSFSFAAGYFNSSAICYLPKNYIIDDTKQYIYGNDDISPKWIIVNNKEYLLNNNQNLLKKMVIKYVELCGHSDLIGGEKNFIYDVGEKQIKNRYIDNYITNGPLTIIKTNIESKLIVYGTVNFSNLNVKGISKIYGSVYGRNGNLNKLNIYGKLNIENSTLNKLSLHGTLNADNIEIKNDAIVSGLVYARNTNINNIFVLSTMTRFDDSIINKLILGNHDDKPKKIILKNTYVEKLIVKGKPLKVNISFDSKIKKSTNAIVVIDEDL
jgi:hypothetical protein